MERGITKGIQDQTEAFFCDEFDVRLEVDVTSVGRIKRSGGHERRYYFGLVKPFNTILLHSEVVTEAAMIELG